MSTLLSLQRDINGLNTYSTQFAADGFNTTLAANAEQHFTVPSTHASWVAIFGYSAGADIFVANNSTAAVPGGSFASAVSQLNPTIKNVNAGDVLSFITANSASPVVCVSLFYVSQLG